MESPACWFGLVDSAPAAKIPPTHHVVSSSAVKRTVWLNKPIPAHALIANGFDYLECVGLCGLHYTFSDFKRKGT